MFAWDKNSHHIYKHQQVLFKFPGQEKTDPASLPALCHLLSISSAARTASLSQHWPQVSGWWDTACKNLEKNKYSQSANTLGVGSIRALHRPLLTTLE